MTKFLSLLISVFIVCLLSAKLITAQQATDSAVKSIRNAVETKLQDQTTNSKKLGLVGQILERTGSSLKVTVDGKDWIIKTIDQTTYEKIPGKTKLKLADLAIQDFAIIKGLEQETKQSLEAQLIQIIPTPDFPDRALYQGTIKTIDKQGFTLTTTDKEPIIKLTTASKIINQSSPSATLKSTTLATKQSVVVAGNVTNSKTGALNADIVIIQTPPEQN